MSATTTAHHHSIINFGFYLARLHELGANMHLQRIINYTHLSHQLNLGKYTNFARAHASRQILGAKRYTQTTTNRPLHSRSRRNSTTHQHNTSQWS